MTKTLAALFALLLVSVSVLPVLAEEEPAAPPAKPEAEADGKAKLLSNGAEPRQVLRYAPTAGAKHDLEMRLALEIESMMGLMVLPTFVMQATYETPSIADNKDFVGKVRMAGFRTEGEDMSGMGGMFLMAFQALEGLEATVTYTCHGDVVSQTFRPAEFPDPGQQQAFQAVKDNIGRMATVVPSEPVGVGAKWTVTRPFQSSGVKGTTVATYEVVKIIDGSQVELAVTVSQTAPEQDVMNPMGFPATVKAYKGEGRGTATLDLSVGTATKAGLEMTVENTSEIDMGMEQPQQFEQVVRSKVTAVAKPAAATTPAGDEGEDDDDGDDEDDQGGMDEDGR